MFTADFVATSGCCCANGDHDSGWRAAGETAWITAAARLLLKINHSDLDDKPAGEYCGCFKVSTAYSLAFIQRRQKCMAAGCGFSFARPSDQNARNVDA
jgi:hypothetical protein